MNRLRFLMKNVNVLNCLLTLAVSAAAYQVTVPFLNVKTRVSLPAIVKVKAAMPATKPTPASLPNPTLADYMPVSEQNLFHPERRIPPEKKEEAAVPKPELILYGTMIADNLSIAYVEDKKAPYSTPGRGQRQKQLKKGDQVSGYTLRDVEPNRIVLVKGQEKLVVMLDNKDKKRSGEAQAPGPATTPSAAAPPRPGLPAAAGRPAGAGAAVAASVPGASRATAAAIPTASPSGVSLPSAAAPTSAASAASGSTASTTPSPTAVTPQPASVPGQRGGQYYTRPGARPFDIRPVPRPATNP